MRHVAILAAVVLAACSDTVGPEGPPGNANVHSQLVTFSTRVADHFGHFASQKYAVAAITPSVVDHGAVLAYARLAGTWTALPYSFAYESRDLAMVDCCVTLGYAYDDALLEVFLDTFGIDPAARDAINAEFAEPLTIKLVVIDGFPLGQVDHSDHAAVVSAYAL